MPDYRDSFDISFETPLVHRLRFTEDVFGADQQVLADLLAPSGDTIPRVQFWLDEHVAEARPGLKAQLRKFADDRAGQMRRVGNVQIVPGGEAIKNDIHILERMLKVFNAADLDRRSYVVVVGGGAVLDAVGFATAIAHRGLRLVRLPTTTLGQGDSGVGVKNGVNLFGKKNWLGSFAAPWGVVNDANLLRSLQDRDFICGFSEAVKVALLKDPAMFTRLCTHAAAIRRREESVALPLLKDSALWHLKHITQGGDPFESNEARPLDFGHWSAHKLESITNFRLRHGEAVAMGVAIDAVYSSLAIGFPRPAAERVVSCLRNLGFNLQDPALERTEELFAGLEEFRQHLGGRLTITLLRDIGDPVDVHQIDHHLMAQAVEQVFDTARTGE